jgi:DNA-binding beta-propeller fold protein YncE
MLNGLIYVSDSRNNRVQVFDDNGKHTISIGELDKIKMSGGIYVTNEELAVTDYQGNRVLIYSLTGKLKQILTENFDQPSDVFIRGKEMFVTNFYSNSISVFTKH